MSNMRKNIILLGIMCMLISLGLSAQSVKREFRGAWIQLFQTGRDTDKQHRPETLP